MRLLDKLSNLLGAASRTREDRLYPVAVKCSRCGEVIETRVNLSNDLSAAYDAAGNITAYTCRKVLVGSQRCFQPIEVTLKFDARRRLIDRAVAGGTFVDASVR